MKNKLFIISFILVSIIYSNKVSKFKVDGMMCISGCVWKVNTITQSIEGVTDSEVDFEKSILTVQYNPEKVNDNLIMSTISKESTYKVRPIKNDSKKAFLNWFRETFK